MRRRKENRARFIFRVDLPDGRRLVIKMINEEDDLHTGLCETEQQSVFSEFLRAHGVRTPRRCPAQGRFCHEFAYDSLPCCVTVEDWCDEKIRQIDAENLPPGWRTDGAHAPFFSLESGLHIGRHTVFGRLLE